MTDFNPYQPPVEPAATPAAEVPPFHPGPSGLGGWLILIGIGVVVSPFTLFAQIVFLLRTVTTDDTWAVLTTPGSEQYHAWWAPLLIGEIGVNSISFTVALYMFYLYFAKKTAFPKWYVGFHSCLLVFVVLDALAVQVVLPEGPLWDPQTIKEVGRCLINVCVWIPYMLVSKRVAATFIR